MGGIDRRTEFNSLVGAINEDPDPNDFRLNLQKLYDFPNASTRREDIINDQNSGPFGNPGSTAEFLFAIFTLDIQRWQAHQASNFKGDDDAARGRSGYQRHTLIPKVICNFGTQRTQDIRPFQHSKLLKIDVAMPTARQQEVSSQNSTRIVQELLQVHALPFLTASL